MPFLPKSEHVWLEDQADKFERLSGSIFCELNGEEGFRKITESEAELKVLRKELFEKLFPGRWQKR
jgi:hypothetical protein